MSVHFPFHHFAGPYLNYQHYFITSTQKTSETGTTESGGVKNNCNVTMGRSFGSCMHLQAPGPAQEKRDMANVSISDSRKQVKVAGGCLVDRRSRKQSGWADQDDHLVILSTTPQRLFFFLLLYKNGWDRQSKQQGAGLR